MPAIHRRSNSTSISARCSTTQKRRTIDNGNSYRDSFPTAGARKDDPSAFFGSTARKRPTTPIQKICRRKKQVNKITAFLDHVGSAVVLLLRSLAHLHHLPRNAKRFINECLAIGYTTLPIVAILSFFIGSVLALQTGYALVDLGGEAFIGAIVGLSMARELAPVMIARSEEHTTELQSRGHLV